MWKLNWKEIGMLERTQSEIKMELKNPTAQVENKEELQVELQVLQWNESSRR